MVKKQEGRNALQQYLGHRGPEGTNAQRHTGQGEPEEMNIQWYPGHMAKTRRMIAGYLPQVDAVCEILDARIPLASRNPDVETLTAGKPRLILLNRVDLADPAGTKCWEIYFQRKGFAVLRVNAREGRGTEKFPAAVRELLAEKLAAYAQKGQTGRTVRVMILGIPNVGKSTFINKVAKRKAAKAENRPGVTRGGQWITVDAGLELLDTPGLLWPKFEDRAVGVKLAYTGAVKDEILDQETLAAGLISYLGRQYPQALRDRYRVEPDEATGNCLLEQAGRNRGFLQKGGDVDTERMARQLLDEFRSGKLGRFTLEMPEEHL